MNQAWKKNVDVGISTSWLVQALDCGFVEDFDGDFLRDDGFAFAGAGGAGVCGAGANAGVGVGIGC